MIHRRNISDEQGLTMVVTVILIALIGVMGAGLLIFATSNLGIVIKSNQGQKALDMAEAGVEAAKLQLSTDCKNNASCYDLYDGGANDSQWSYSKPLSGCSPGTTGVCLSNLDGASSTDDVVNVRIRYTSGAYTAVSTGQYGDTKRRVEAIFEVTSTGGLPSGFPQMIWSETRITGRETYVDSIPMFGKTGLDFSYAALFGLSGSSLTLNGASAFSGGDVKLRKSLLGALQLTETGTDKTFGNWNVAPYNTKSRTSNTSGIGASGTISPAPGNVGSVNFDSSTFPTKFVYSSPSSTQITYPFDENAIQNNLSTLTAKLETTARRQGNYVELNSSKTELRICTVVATCGGGSNVQRLTWPTSTASNPYPVVYVKFNAGNAATNGTSNLVRWSVLPQVDASANLAPATGIANTVLCPTLQGQLPIPGIGSALDLSRKGVLVVDNGDFVWQGSTATLPLAPLNGAVVVNSGSGSSDAVIGDDNLCTKGPIIADGSFALNNPAYFGALSASDYADLPGFANTYAPNEIGWREVYE